MKDLFMILQNMNKLFRKKFLQETTIHSFKINKTLNEEKELTIMIHKLFRVSPNWSWDTYL